MLTPSLGLLTGGGDGFAAQLSYSLQAKRLQIDLQHQYAILLRGGRNFYFNWSSLQYNVVRKWLIGASVQSTVGGLGDAIDGGYLLGYQGKRAGVVLFHFNAYDWKRQYIYAGIQLKL